MPEQLDLGFYNLEESRPKFQVHREVTMLCQHGGRKGRPLDVLGLCEAVGNTLPPVKDMKKIRDVSTKARANIAAYVNPEVYGRHYWVDLKKTWPRVKHPHLGQHPPRSFLVIVLADGTQVVVFHMPQRPLPSHGEATARALVDARMEHLNALVEVMAPWSRETWEKRASGAQRRALTRARLGLTDYNARLDDPIVKALCSRAKLQVHGRPVDLLFEREVEVTRGPEYVERLQSIAFQSDHQHAYLATVRL